MALEPRVDRIEPRIPFFAPVIASGLTRCRATNISSGGIGLTAFVERANPPARGDELELELVLGDTKRAIRVIGRVAWSTKVRPDGRLGLGAQFREIAPDARAALALFLSSHRPRTLLALASPAEQSSPAARSGSSSSSSSTSPSSSTTRSSRRAPRWSCSATTPRA